IDEEGCRAAAFTTISVSMAPPPPGEIVEITFDRPFLFVVTGNDGVTLFMGIVNNPAAN
ncbi:MAG: serpin family protein, partial [Clostridia bacterium]|nr:serpin family protein [Clostridia bacterium]